MWAFTSSGQKTLFDSLGLPVFWYALQVGFPSVSLGYSFPQPYVKSVCWLWQRACVCWNSDCCVTLSSLQSFFFKMCSLCPGQIPKLSVLCLSHVQDLMKGSWELEVCGRADILHSIESIRPRIVWSRT